MGKTAFVFPGQGAQQVGMGKDLVEAYPEAAAWYAQVDEVLGYNLSELIFNGPEDELRLTYHTQPALLATSMALYEQVSKKGLRPDYVAGHSLGEYSALAAAGALSATDALQLVRARGLFMENAVPAGQGAMAAVLGAEREALAALCARITAEHAVVELANMNCPGQIVVSGTAEGVAQLIAVAKEAGAKRAIPLEVSGPFHSSLMKAAAEQLADKLSEITFKQPTVPLIANVTAQPVQDPLLLADLLVKQVYSPVLWEDSVQWLLEAGVDTFVEIGPGKVLAGLIRKINRDAKVISISDLETLAAL